MELYELITEDRIYRLDPQDADKYKMIAQVLRRLCKSAKLQEFEDEILEAMLKRENSMSTGIGSGIALPHCSTPHVADPIGSLVILESPLEFQAIDDLPVRIMVMMLLPENKFDRHIKTLAGIAKLFNDASFREHLLEIKEEPEIFECISLECSKRSK